MSSLRQIILLIAATFVSEDLTCITAGQMLRRSELSWTVAAGGCAFGIFAGDVGLWLLGRTLGRRALKVRFIRRRLTRPTEWIQRNLFKSVIAARFVPGTRLPLYLAAGIASENSRRFLLAALIASLLWTPAIVLLVAFFGGSFVRPFEQFIGAGSLALLVSVVITYLILNVVRLAITEIGRAKIIARVSILWRWEFWPMIIFYPPVALWVIWLSLRHRGFTTITAANPGIPHGGFVGESKFQILSNLKSDRVIATALINAIDPNVRLAQFDCAMQENRLSFPVILKPDVGQRGAGVRLICAREAASEYLQSTGSAAVLVQQFHPGPFEAGIFYYRNPGKSRGKIFSITDKHFAHLIGDGVSTIEQLIWRHPRYRMQAGTFLKRHAGQIARVLKNGEPFSLALAGNHCQGTMFRDGAHLITPKLERAIDEIAKSFRGFYFGRFDVRYNDPEQFKTGQEFMIIELNGITSESTNIYDPGRSLFWAYRMLYAQWSILFHIGEANCAVGYRASRLRDLLRDVLKYYASPRAEMLSD